MSSIKELGVIVPTRGRPENVKRQLIAASGAQTNWKTTSFVYAIDDTDPKCWDYLRLLQVRAGVSLVRHEGHPKMVEKLNATAVPLAEDCFYKYIGFMGDDHLPRTPGWDAQVIEALQDTPIVYGNDLYQGENIPTAVFMDARVIAALGYMCPPAIWHLYCDVYWKDLGKHIGIKYLPGTVIEHMHPVAPGGKAEWDDQYRTVNSAEYFAHDETAYREFTALGGLVSDALRVLEVLNISRVRD